MMRPKSILISIALIVFAGFWTYLTIRAIPSNSPAVVGGALAPQTDVWIAYAAIASASWVLAVCSVLRLSRKGRAEWRRAGFDDSTIDIMSESRGAFSRLKILEVLRNPNQRGYVSDATGIDWREVDREVRLLEGLGLVELQTKQGHRQLFGLTGKGGVALGLLRNKLSGEKGEGEASEARTDQTR